jgi:hypothetical protein
MQPGFHEVIARLQKVERGECQNVSKPRVARREFCENSITSPEVVAVIAQILKCLSAKNFSLSDLATGRLLVRKLSSHAAGGISSTVGSWRRLN